MRFDFDFIKHTQKSTNKSNNNDSFEPKSRWETNLHATDINRNMTSNGDHVLRINEEYYTDLYESKIQDQFPNNVKLSS